MSTRYKAVSGNSRTSSKPNYPYDETGGNVQFISEDVTFTSLQDNRTTTSEAVAQRIDQRFTYTEVRIEKRAYLWENVATVLSEYRFPVLSPDQPFSTLLFDIYREQMISPEGAPMLYLSPLETFDGVAYPTRYGFALQSALVCKRTVITHEMATLFAHLIGAPNATSRYDPIFIFNDDNKYTDEYAVALVESSGFVDGIPAHFTWASEVMNGLIEWYEQACGMNVGKILNKPEIFWEVITSLVEALNIPPILKRVIIPYLKVQSCSGEVHFIPTDMYRISTCRGSLNKSLILQTRFDILVWTNRKSKSIAEQMMKLPNEYTCHVGFQQRQQLFNSPVFSIHSGWLARTVTANSSFRSMLDSVRLIRNASPKNTSACYHTVIERAAFTFSFFHVGTFDNIVIMDWFIPQNVMKFLYAGLHQLLLLPDVNMSKNIYLSYSSLFYIDILEVFTRFDYNNGVEFLNNIPHIGLIIKRFLEFFAPNPSGGFVLRDGGSNGHFESSRFAEHACLFTTAWHNAIETNFTDQLKLIHEEKNVEKRIQKEELLKHDTYAKHADFQTFIDKNLLKCDHLINIAGFFTEIIEIYDIVFGKSVTDPHCTEVFDLISTMIFNHNGQFVGPNSSLRLDPGLVVQLCGSFHRESKMFGKFANDTTDIAIKANVIPPSEKLEVQHLWEAVEVAIAFLLIPIFIADGEVLDGMYILRDMSTQLGRLQAELATITARDNEFMDHNLPTLSQRFRQASLNDNAIIDSAEGDIVQ
jgi:hypothetical protein